ncbi:MAG: thioredoxin-disulfide reductase [Syntrophobacteraceae bacterium]|jgi:thioredoxin reductase (NADPH)
MPEQIFDVIIVGGGPAGLAAGIYAMRAAMKTVLIEKGLPGGQVAITKGVENYPGFTDITGFELSDKFLEHAKLYGLEIMQREVVAVELGVDFHSVRLENGVILKTHSIIIATGGKARKLGVPGEIENFGKGVSYCATCDGFFFKNKIVAVVGGGDTALEDALYLARIAERVYLIHRRDEFRGSKILQKRVLAEPKIEVVLNTVVTEIRADELEVRTVALKNKQGDERELEVNGVFIFAGFSPDNSLVPGGVKTDSAGYVLTDEKCETNIPGIFAAGDLRQKYANQIVIAASDGCIAALAAARYVEAKRAAENDTKL